MKERIGSRNELDEKERIDAIYENCLAEQTGFLDIHASMGEERLKGFIGAELRRIDSLEVAGEENEANRFAIAPDVAKKIGALWVFSGPGTYHKPFKEDRYKDFAWTQWMDRNRLQRAAILARHIAEAKSGVIPGRLKGDVKKEREALRKMIEEYAPYIIYNGAPVENATVAGLLEEEDAVFTKETVKIIDEPIDNTVDQMETFSLPDDPSLEGKEVAILSHAPHLDRVLHFLPRHNSLPKRAVPRLFPVSTPESGRAEYAQTEIRGVLYYSFISKKQEATEEISPYTLNNES